MSQNWLEQLKFKLQKWIENHSWVMSWNWHNVYPRKYYSGHQHLAWIPLTPGLSRASWTLQWISLYEVSWCVCMLNPKCHSQMMMDRSLLHVNLKLVTVSIAQKSTLCAIGFWPWLGMTRGKRLIILAITLDKQCWACQDSDWTVNNISISWALKTTLPQCKSQWKPMSNMSHFKHTFHLQR